MRLLAGLQLSPGTVLLVDETGMSTGKLNASATENITALQSVVERQLLPVNFGAYDLDYETEVPALVITEQGQSVLRDVGYVAVPLAADGATGHVSAALQEAETDPRAAHWTPVRRYLASVRSFTQPIDYLSEEMQNQVEQTFLTLRKADDLITQQSLFAWMTLARALVASHGETALSPARWGEVMRLEEARRDRLRGLQNKSASTSSRLRPGQVWA